MQFTFRSNRKDWIRKMIFKKLGVEVVPGHITNCYIVVDEDTKEAMIVDPRFRGK